MLTSEQRKQERALALSIWLDSLLAVPYAIVTIWVGSLAMLSELLRGGLLLIVTGFSLRTLRRTHRGLIADYDYGIGKLERALSGAVAFLLLLAAGFIVWRAFVLGPETPTSHFLRMLAIVFVFMNLLVNTIPAISLWRATRSQPSVIALSQFRARLAKAVGSVVVVTCVAIHSLASDPMTGRIADTVGALFVVGFMVVVAVGLLLEALPDLLDRRHRRADAGAGQPNAGRFLSRLRRADFGTHAPVRQHRPRRDHAGFRPKQNHGRGLPDYCPDAGSSPEREPRQRHRYRATRCWLEGQQQQGL
jgi:divalent metal cation (Fe/Co/Zn/Cd) transporter